MNLKGFIRTLLYIAPLIGLSEGLTSCSDIPEDERLIYIEPAKAVRNVLIEDFTGQRCVNCPKAADAIQEMHDVYGSNVVAVAIHCGKFGGLSPKDPGLMTDTGKEYWNFWFDSSQGQPVAKINRGPATNDYQNWAAEVNAQLQIVTDVNLEAETALDSESNELSINVNTKAREGRSGKIQVWLTENNIVARQFMPDGSKNDEYVHQHVFRAAVNGTWGENITYGQDEIKLGWKAKLDPKWKAENLNVVVFVYSDQGVEQVIQVPAIPTKDEQAN